MATRASIEQLADKITNVVTVIVVGVALVLLFHSWWVVLKQRFQAAPIPRHTVGHVLGADTVPGCTWF